MVCIYSILAINFASLSSTCTVVSTSARSQVSQASIEWQMNGTPVTMTGNRLISPTAVQQSPKSSTMSPPLSYDQILSTRHQSHSDTTVHWRSFFSPAPYAPSSSTQPFRLIIESFLACITVTVSDPHLLLNLYPVFV